jgi:hypothetical protein
VVNFHFFLRLTTVVGEIAVSSLLFAVLELFCPNCAQFACALQCRLRIRVSAEAHRTVPNVFLAECPNLYVVTLDFRCDKDVIGFIGKFLCPSDRWCTKRFIPRLDAMAQGLRERGPISTASELTAKFVVVVKERTFYVFGLRISMPRG